MKRAAKISCLDSLIVMNRFHIRPLNKLIQTSEDMINYAFNKKVEICLKVLDEWDEDEPDRGQLCSFDTI